jgi:hypothetical protein
MNQERLMLKGQLADLIHNLKDKDVEAKGLILLIRTVLNPYEEDITHIKTGESLASLNRLHEIITEMRRLKAKIAEIEDALHG